MKSVREIQIRLDRNCKNANYLAINEIENVSDQ